MTINLTCGNIKMKLVISLKIISRQAIRMKLILSTTKTLGYLRQAYAPLSALPAPFVVLTESATI